MKSNLMRLFRIILQKKKPVFFKKILVTYLGKFLNWFIDSGIGRRVAIASYNIILKWILF